jgi:hypothetical protein
MLFAAASVLEILVLKSGMALKVNLITTRVKPACKLSPGRLCGTQRSEMPVDSTKAARPAQYPFLKRTHEAFA